MLIMRLQRTGRAHEPTFRVVLTDSKNAPKSGKYLENLGWFDKRLDNKLEQLNVERIKYWISKGAQMSGTLNNFLVSKKAVKGEKVSVTHRKVKKGAETATANTPASTPAPAETPTPTA